MKTDPNEPYERAAVDLWYPQVREVGCIDVIEIQLIAVRSARSIRVHYDFERDGYVISAKSDNPDEPWAESTPYAEKAFIPAWEEFPTCRNLSESSVASCSSGAIGLVSSCAEM
jgi:hypothetical protein